MEKRTVGDMDAVSCKKGWRKALTSEWLWYAIAVAVMTAQVACIAIDQGGARMTFDSPGYIVAGDRLKLGVVDLLRTPVYPLFLAAIRWIFQFSWPVALVVIQYLVFVASAWALRKIAIGYIGRNMITVILVCLYIILPGQSVFIASVLTETFATAGVIFLILHLTRSLPASPTMADSVMSAIWLLFLIFLRPIFICLIPVCGVYYLIVLYRNRRNRQRAGIYTGLAGCLISLAAVAGYQGWVKHTHGVYVMSSVSTINNYHLLRESGILEPALCTDSAIRAQLASYPPVPQGDPGTQYWKEINTLTNHYPAAPLHDYVSRAMRSHPKEVSARIAERFLMDSPRYKIFSDDEYLKNNPLEILYPNIAIYWLLMGIFAAVGVMQWYRKRLMPLESALLWSITGVLTAISIGGAMAEWDRLIMPGIPAFLLLTGALCARLLRRRPFA